MNKRIIITIVSLLSIIVHSTGFGASFEETLTKAFQALEMKKGDHNLLLLTDAPYVSVDGKCALPYLNLAQEQTGCTVGKGNLLFFQRGQSHPLLLLLMRKSDSEAVIITREDKDWLIEKMNLSPATISSPAFWEKAKSFKTSKDISSLAAIAAVWAQDGPYDFLKTAELHNHICPGLTSGYLIAHFIQKHFPLKEGQKYTIVASPTWCKEDALQVILDATPGKRTMVVNPLTKGQTNEIAFANPAGMVLLWDGKSKTGKGYALTCDLNPIKALSPKESPKVATVLAALDQLDEPDRFIGIASEFVLNEKLYTDITTAGNNPYEVTGLIKK